MVRSETLRDGLHMTVCMAVVAEGIRGDLETYNEAILGYAYPLDWNLDLIETQGSA